LLNTRRSVLTLAGVNSTLQTSMEAAEELMHHPFAFIFSLSPIAYARFSRDCGLLVNTDVLSG
jgi:hypothetical protein